MKGVVSFLYLFSIFAYFLIVISIYLSVYERVNYLEYNVFLLEDRVSRELEIKHAMKDVIAYSQELEEYSNLLPAPYNMISGSILSEYGISKLVELESTGASSYYDWRRFALDFWCGFPTDSDIVNAISIKDKAYPAFFNSAFTCDNCFKLDSKVQSEKGPSNLCSQFLSSDLINRNTRIGVAKVDEIAVDGATYDLSNLGAIQGVRFGVLIYDSKENVSSAVVIPSSTTIPWRNVTKILVLEGII